MSESEFIKHVIEKLRLKEIILSATIFMLLIIILENLRLTIYPLFNRVNLIVVQDLNVLGSQLVDNIFLTTASSASAIFILPGLVPRIALILVSVLMISLTLANYIPLTSFIAFSLIQAIAIIAIQIFQTYQCRMKQGFVDFFRRVVFYLAGIGAIIEAGAALTWLVNLFFGMKTYSGPLWKFAEIDLNIFYGTALVGPIIILIICYSFVYRFLILPNFKSLKNLLIKENIEVSFSRKQSVILFNLGIALCIFFPLIPYLPTINPTSQIISTDAPSYYDSINVISGLIIRGDSFLALENAFSQYNGDRPLTLILLALTKSLIGISLEDLLRVIFIPLSASFGIACYSIVKKGTGNQSKAIWTLIFAGTSFPVLAGVYAGFLANLIGLIISLVAIYFLFCVSKRITQRNCIILFITSILVLFFHSYTWTFLLASIVTLAILSAVIDLRRRQIQNRRQYYYLLIALISSNIAADLVRAELMNDAISIQRSFEIPAEQLGSNPISYEEFESRWYNLKYNFTIYLGGLFGNTIVLFSVLIWMIRSDHGPILNMYLASSFFAAAIPIAFGSYLVQSRILYDLPIFIAFSLLASNLAVSRSKLSRMTFVFIFFALITYALRSYQNLIFIPPQI